jgi:signal peptidase I
MSQSGRAPSGRARPVLWSVLRKAEHGFAAIGVAFVLYSLCFDLSVMISGSMSPTLQGTSSENGDYVLTEKLSYWFRHPRRWEVVTFRNSEGLQVMKRVAGLPGETVSLTNYQVLIDGSPIERPAGLAFLTYYPLGNLSRGEAAPCGEGYYVLGDDSRDSQDSRFEGPVNPQRIRGRAWLIVWPLSRVRFINR